VILICAIEITSKLRKGGGGGGRTFSKNQPGKEASI